MGVIVQNVNVYLVDRGSGRPVLFLHGVPDTAEIWSDVITRLSTGYRCLAPDLPGFGRSIAPPKFDCSLENRVDFINELVENKRIKSSEDQTQTNQRTPGVEDEQEQHTSQSPGNMQNCMRNMSEHKTNDEGRCDRRESRNKS
jgi:hypothetical protein